MPAGGTSHKMRPGHVRKHLTGAKRLAWPWAFRRWQWDVQRREQREMFAWSRAGQRVVVVVDKVSQGGLNRLPGIPEHGQCLVMGGIGGRRRQGLGRHERILARPQPPSTVCGVLLLLAVAGTGALALAFQRSRLKLRARGRRSEGFGISTWDAAALADGRRVARTPCPLATRVEVRKKRSGRRHGAGHLPASSQPRWAGSG
jgi:hypothetical protein